MKNEKKILDFGTVFEIKMEITNSSNSEVELDDEIFFIFYSKC
jgi:hypothetical protein